MRSRILLLLVSLVLCATSASAAANEYLVKPVIYKDLVANLYLPKAVAKAPVVIAFGGSDGGLHDGVMTQQFLHRSGR